MACSCVLSALHHKRAMQRLVLAAAIAKARELLRSVAFYSFDRAQRLWRVLGFSGRDSPSRSLRTRSCLCQ